MAKECFSIYKDMKVLLHNLWMQIAAEDQVAAGTYREGIAVGDDEEVVGDGGDGGIIVVGDDDAVVRTALPDQFLYGLDALRIYLGKWLVE